MTGRQYNRVFVAGLTATREDVAREDDQMSATAPITLQAAYATFDEALEQLAAYGPDLRNGMTSHAPMVAEALCAIGRPDAVPPWIERYRTGMLPWPAAQARLTADTWRDALGDERRVADWRAQFSAELRDAAWPLVLDRWVARLAPGVCAAATHGVIRVGHAVRGLTVEHTAPRLQELADALSSWAATYQELPTRFGAVQAHATPRRALEHVSIVPAAQRRFSGTITGSLAALAEWPAFAPVIGLLDLSGDPAALVAALRDLCIELYLANARDVLTSIVFVHGVTAVSAVGVLLPHLCDDTARRAVRYAWQASCGLYAAFGTTIASRAAPVSDASTAALLECAVAHGDEHVIKFAAACLDHRATRAGAAAHAAVQHALTALPRPH